MNFKGYFVIALVVFLSVNLYGQQFKSYDFKEFEPILNKQDNNTYVVNFWATWCGPCVEEIPAFVELQKNYSNKNVKIIMVSLDFGRNVQERIRSFKDRHNMNLEIIILDDPDSNSWINKVNEDWSGALPATIIYNKSNKSFFEKSFTYSELEKELLKYL